jgi:hypothetical protein
MHLHPLSSFGGEAQPLVGSFGEVCGFSVKEEKLPRNTNGVNSLREYARKLTGNLQPLPDDIEFGFMIGSDLDPYNQLVAGLATFCRACLDIAELFRAAAEASEGKRTIEKLIIALLFEVRGNVESWVDKKVEGFYESTSRDNSRIRQLARRLYREFEQHRRVMKEIRDRVFHRVLSHNDDAVDYIVGLMYERNIPGLLHKRLFEYGVEIVSAMSEDGIGIPGIGCFGVFPIEGAGKGKMPFDNPYTPK